MGRASQCPPPEKLSFAHTRRQRDTSGAPSSFPPRAAATTATVCRSDYATGTTAALPFE